MREGGRGDSGVCDGERDRMGVGDNLINTDWIWRGGRGETVGVYDGERDRG